MMTRILRPLLTIVVMVIVCCTTNAFAQENKQQADTSKKITNFRQLALGKEYIHVDTSLIHSKIGYQESTETDSEISRTNPVQQLVSNKDLIPFMAATYRYYKHLKIVDGLYVNDLASGKDIQVSEAVFLILKNNTDRLNTKIKSITKAEGEVEMPDIDQYLNWMLTHDWSKH